MAKHKAKARYSPRKTATRQPYDYVLIVVEGKTEINYFQSLINSLKLSTANIEVLDIKQNTPDSLFTEAKKLYNKAKKEGNPYDKVYCIFDKDGHAKYQETKHHIDQATPKNIYYYAFSEPCFEYWLLLHYVNTTKPFAKFKDLKRDKNFKCHFPDYKKSDNIFETLKDKISSACSHAKNNPHTNIDKLVQYLQQIK